MAIRLKEKGYSNVEIGKRMGIPEATVRNLLNPLVQEKTSSQSSNNKVKDHTEKGLLDVGVHLQWVNYVSQN